jgi:hypothetical protein
VFPFTDVRISLANFSDQRHLSQQHCKKTYVTVSTHLLTPLNQQSSEHKIPALFDGAGIPFVRVFKQD